MRAEIKILAGACTFPRIQYIQDYAVLPLLITNPWISLCYSQFYVLYWYFSSPFYRFFVWCLLTCHNDVIDAGHNNRLFALGTDMDRERLRLSHVQNGTDNVQICDTAEILLKVASITITLYRVYCIKMGFFFYRICKFGFVFAKIHLQISYEII